MNRYSLPGRAQGQVGWDLEQSGLVEDIPTHFSRIGTQLSLRLLPTLNYSMILWFCGCIVLWSSHRTSYTSAVSPCGLTCIGNVTTCSEVILFFPRKTPVFSKRWPHAERGFGEEEGDTSCRCLQCRYCYLNLLSSQLSRVCMVCSSLSALCTLLPEVSEVASRQITSYTNWLITILHPITTYYQSSKQKQNICTHWNEGHELNAECVSYFQLSS